MPKLKTKRGGGEAFSQDGERRSKRGQSHRRHILTEEAQQAKASAAHRTMVHKTDVDRVKQMLPHS